MNIVAKTTYGKFVMVCHGKFRDLSGVAVIKCKKASKKISANFILADQVQWRDWDCNRESETIYIQGLNCPNSLFFHIVCLQNVTLDMLRDVLCHILW